MRKHIVRFLLWCLAKIGYSVVPLEMERAAQAEIAALKDAHQHQIDSILTHADTEQKAAEFEIETLKDRHRVEQKQLQAEMKARVLKASRILPDSMLPLREEVILLCAEEAGLIHGSTDILGDSWLKFRRVASKLKKAHPELPKADIFKSIIIICEEASDVPA